MTTDPPSTASPASSYNARFASIPSIIRSIFPTVITFSRPFVRLPNKAKFGARMTAIQCGGQKVFLFSPIQIEETVKAAVDRMGKVEWILCPDIEHYIYMPEWKAAFPSAKVIGVPTLPEAVAKLCESKGWPKVEWEGILGETDPVKKYGFEDEIALRYCPGFVNKDVLAFHKPTKTLLTADMYFNLPAKEQFSQARSSTEPAGWLESFSNWTLNSSSIANKLIFYYVLAAKDRSDIGAAARTVVGEWKPEVLIPCHGDVIEKDATAKWEYLYSWFLKL